MAQPPMIQIHSPHHAAVRTAQVLLTRKGFLCRPIDGLFGPQTDRQVRRFQSRVGLHVDGVVGPRTWARLYAGAKPPPLPSPTPHQNALSSYAMADIALAWARSGRPYVWDGKAVPITRLTAPPGLDCSGLVEWAVARVTGEQWVAGSKYQAAASRRITVAQAIRTKGALLFESHNGYASGVHHVAVSMGDGMTAEARGAHMNPECGSFMAAGRFNLAGLVPVLRY